jgi:hypothetical protein
MTLETIDFSEQLNAIRCKYNDNWRSAAYRAEKAALWGYGADSQVVNDCGVITDAEEEMLYEKRMAYARVSLAQTPIGLWIYAIDWMSQTCGGGYATSINTAIGYKSREDARLAGIEKLIFRFEQITAAGGFSDAEIKQAFEIVQRLNEEKTPQLALW